MAEPETTAEHTTYAGTSDVPNHQHGKGHQ
jgi:hypothetical protein